jgi:plastocyanin
MKALRALMLVSVVALLALGAGCGGDDNKDNATTTATNTTPTKTTATGGGAAGTKAVTVAMDEYSFTPDSVTVSKGGTITADNKGKISHNLTIEQGPDPKKATKKLEGTSTFLPGKTEKVKVDLSPGKYSMVCTVPGHRELGMAGTVTVK